MLAFEFRYQLFHSFDNHHIIIGKAVLHKLTYLLGNFS